jgi:predicted DNA-binding protein (MmcQ/YjbR family)
MRQLHELCRSFPGVTEDVKWEDHRCFSVGGKMFAVFPVDDTTEDSFVTFKCTPEDFARLRATPGYMPAPYLARAQWATVTSRRVALGPEVPGLLRTSYELIRAKLPKKVQATLASAPAQPSPPRSDGRKMKPKRRKGSP